MSARDELYAEVMSGGTHSPDRSERASALIDAYAHELAEKIRSSGMPGKFGVFYGPGVSAYRDGSDDAANLIDPEGAKWTRGTRN